MHFIKAIIKLKNPAVEVWLKRVSASTIDKTSLRIDNSGEGERETEKIPAISPQAIFELQSDAQSKVTDMGMI